MGVVIWSRLFSVKFISVSRFIGWVKIGSDDRFLIEYGIVVWFVKNFVNFIVWRLKVFCFLLEWNDF